MNKKIYLLLAWLCCLLPAASSAQTNPRTAFVHLRLWDQYAYPFVGITQVYIRNTDSVSHPVNPYISTNLYSGYGYYSDSMLIDSAYTDSLITIHYYACGQWFTQDGILSTNSWRAEKVFSDTLPCPVPCNADFNVFTDDHLEAVRAYPKISYHPRQVGGWTAGDASAAKFQSALSHTYAALGNYNITHWVLDTVSGCRDTVVKTISLNPHCMSGFSYTQTANKSYNFSTPFNGDPGYSHSWDMGDGWTYNGVRNLNHGFSSTGSYRVVHKVWYGTTCIDSTVNVIYMQACTTAMPTWTTQLNRFTFTPPNNTDTFTFTFEDSVSFTQRGPVSYTFSYSGIQTVKVVDYRKTCVPRSFTVNTSNTCSQYFQYTNDSAWRFKLTYSGPSYYNYRYITNTGDTINSGDSFYVFSPSTSYRTLRGEILDSAGNVLCRPHPYGIWFNSCGYTNWQSKHNLYGRVYFNRQAAVPYDSLVVYLITYDASLGLLSAVDSQVHRSNMNDTVFFYFEGLCDPAQYYRVKAALLPGSGLYNDFLPTYSDSSATWSGADSFLHGNYVEINMLAGTNPGGPGFIGGYVSQGANKNGQALEGIQVNLFNAAGRPIATVYTSSGGRYEFRNLALGEYQIQVEIIGKPSDRHVVTLTQDNPGADEFNFEVNRTYISTILSGLKNVISEAALFPNPVESKLHVRLPAAVHQAEYFIYAVDGSLIRSGHLVLTDGEAVIETSLLKQGLYLLRLQSDAQIFVNRFQKN